MDKQLLAALLLSGGVIAVLVIIPLATSMQSPPEEFVDRQTAEQEDGFFYTVETTRLPASLKISGNRSKIGVAVEPFRLSFGALPPNVSATKLVEVVNSGENRVKVRTVAYGNISPYIEPQDSFILPPNKSRTLEVRGSGDRIGSYTGEYHIITERPRNVWARWLLPLT